MDTPLAGEPAPRRKRRLQFGLRRFLILVAVVGTLAGTLGVRFYRDRQRQLAMEAISAVNGRFEASKRGGNRLYLKGPGIDNAVLADLVPRMPFLPELVELDLVATTITDEGIGVLKRRGELKSLWVFQSQVTDEALNNLQQALPELQIYTKQPDPIASKLAMRPVFRHAIVSLAAQPNGGLLAAGNGEGQLRLWNSPTSNPASPIAAHQDWLFTLAFSHDGTRLATGGGDNLIKLWDTATRKPVGELRGHTNDVHAVAFSTDDRWLASTGDDRTVRVWDLDSGKERFVLTGHTATIPTLAISPDGRTIASGSRDNTIRLWDLERGELLRVLKGHRDNVLGVRFSPDGQTLASVSYDGTVRLWNLDGTPRGLLTEHRGRAFSLAFSPDGARIASGGVDGVRISDLETREQLEWWPEQAWVSAVLFLDEGRALATASAEGELLVRRVDDSMPLAHWRDPSSLLSPGDEVLAGH